MQKAPINFQVNSPTKATCKVELISTFLFLKYITINRARLLLSLYLVRIL